MFGDSIDIDRMNRRLDDIFKIGRTERGGVQRHPYTEEEQAAHDYVKDELPDGYTVTTDKVGNLFATRYPDADEYLYVGSHLDNNPNGGRLDGALGIITALEAMEAVHRTGERPDTPPMLAVWRAEESARFGIHTTGSRMVLGLLSEKQLRSDDKMGLKDITLEEAVRKAGFEPPEPGETLIDEDDVAGYIEPHIEQGRVLDEEDESLGIVTSIRAPTRYVLTVYGEEDHSGATPMAYRKDAVAGAAEMVIEIERTAKRASDEGDVVATVGSFKPVDGVINKVNGEVTFTLDVRSNDLPFRNEFIEDIFDTMQEIADERDLSLEPELVDETDPVTLDESVIDLLDEGARQLGQPYRQMPCGAGHDAMNFQTVGTPTGMLFVPSIDGISHNPNELTPEQSIVDVTNVLGYTIQRYSL